METIEQFQARRDELTEQILAAESWDATATLRAERDEIDARLNPQRARNAKSRARRAMNPHPNGGHTRRGQRR